MLYSGAGDRGTTTTYHAGSGKLSKASSLIEALGNIDELNAWLGLCKAQLTDKAGQALLEDAQQNLFIVQAEIGGAKKKITLGSVRSLQIIINDIAAKVGPIRTFLISGATRESAYLGVARTVARRAERSVIKAVANQELKISSQTKAYLNRLSSLLYVLERLANQQAKVGEKPPRYG